MKILTSDIEANNWIDFLMIGLYDGKEFLIFYDIKDYLRYVLKLDSCIIYFHNGSRYDFLFLYDYILDKYDVQFVNRGTQVIGLKVFTENAVIEFRDSYALLPFSLEKLIESFNIDTKKVEIDFNKKWTKKSRLMKEHLKNDCIALYKVLQKFFERERYRSYTIASLSLKRFLDFSGCEIWSVNSKYDNYYRGNYYRGGRVEVYKMYGKNLYYYDINSLYPYVMLEKMPVNEPIKIKRYKSNKIGFYKIELLQDTNDYISVLSVKNKNGIYYVNGCKHDIFYLTSAELELLLENNVKFKIIDGYYFEKCEYLFNDYVNYYYDLKLNAKDNIDRTIAKLMLNSLYGKFGQRLIGYEMTNKPKKNQDAIIIDESYNILLYEKKLNLKFNGVYIAAYITALARKRHYELMKSIGFENIFYCDTDSIITNKKLKTDLVNENIGNLKLVDKIKEAVFLLPKTYCYKNFENKEKSVVKGFSENISLEKMKELLFKKIDKIEIEYLRMLGFRESLRRVNKDNIIKENGILKLVKQTKTLELNLLRRKYIENKKYVYDSIPFLLSELNNK